MERGTPFQVYSGLITLNVEHILADDSEFGHCELTLGLEIVDQGLNSVD